MNCPRCQHDNLPEARYCEACAAVMALACSNCGGQLRPAAKFCPSCAHPVAPQLAAPTRCGSRETYTPRHIAEKIRISKSALEGERKQVTVLFADIKGSMELLAHRDPEEARELLDSVLERMLEAVHRYEGTVNQVMGDGIMALFGAPLALEDHAVRACYAALRMKEAVSRYAGEIERSRGTPVRIRIGLNSGEVVVRAIGSDLNMDYTAVGETTHLAARMEQSAEPGTALITSATRRLVGDAIVARSLGARLVKGQDAPIEVYELVGAVPARSQRRARTQTVGRCVGRETELDRLHKLLDEARKGRGQVTALAAEPGIGKSRLIHELVNSAEAQGWQILESEALAYDKTVSWGPVVDVLWRHFELSDDSPPEAVAARLRTRMLALDPELESSLAPILLLLDVLPEADPFWALEPRERREAIVTALIRLIVKEAGRKPLLLVFENLQWVDSETQNFLDMLLARMNGAPVFLLVAYRPEHKSAWRDVPNFTELALEPISRAAAGELLDGLIGRARSQGPLRNLLIERSGGNPFFLEETVRMLVETGELVGELGHYRLAAESRDLQVPANVRALLAARIDRLTQDEKFLLQAAAVTGAEISFALIEMVTDFPVVTLRPLLQQLEAAGYLSEAGLFPDIEYRFRNALTREVAYSSLLREQRRILHVRIVEAIERLYGDRLSTQLDLLAHHASLGELWAKAAIYNQQVGIRAVARAANLEAVRALQAALAAQSHLPSSRESVERAIDLRLDLRPPLLQLGRLDEVLVVSREAEPLAEQIGDQQRLSRIYSYLVNYHYLKGESRLAIEYGERCLGAGESCGDIVLQGLAQQYVGQSYHALGDYSRAERALRENIGLLGPQQRGSSAYVASCGWLAFTLADIGNFDAAQANLDEAHSAAEASRHPWSQAIAWTMAGLVAIRRGHLAQAVLPLERSLEACRRKRLKLWQPIPLSLLGLAFVRMGHVTDAMPLLEQGVALSQELGVRAYLAAWMANLAEGLLADGRTERAQEVAKEALEVARASGERGHEAILLELSGRIAAQGAAPEIEEARRCFSAARLLADEIGLRPLLAAIDFETAALLARNNDAPIARAQRATADHQLAAGLGMRGWQEQPEAEATELGHLFIVSRSNPEMYEFLVNEFSEARRIQIVADRRLDDRPTPYDKDLRNWGLALVPSGERRAPPPEPAPG